MRTSMSVNGYWDAAFEAAVSEKSEALTRTLQWIDGDRIRISGDYEVVYRKRASAAGTQSEMDLSMVTQNQRQLSLPLQAVVLPEASASAKQSRRKLETELVDAFGEKFGMYTVPVVYLSESCQDTLFEPVLLSETNNLNKQSDMALWSQSVDRVSAGLRSDVAARYADNLLKAS